MLRELQSLCVTVIQEETYTHFSQIMRKKTLSG